MRPVIRGMPTHYDPSGANTAVSNLVAIQQRIIVVRRKQTDIDGKIPDSVEFSRRSKQTIRALKNATLYDLETAEGPLTNTFDYAYDNSDEDNIIKTGRLLSYNLELQIVLLNDLFEKTDESKVARTYVLSRADLINNIGQYCSFCGMPLAASLAVEHMLPKADFPGLSVTWSNFLLACPICNSKKNKFPSLFSSTIRAQVDNQKTDVTLEEIRAGGYELMLWSSDDAIRYPNFSSKFQYDLRKVQYGSSPYPIHTSLIDSSLLSYLVSNEAIEFDNDDGDQVYARFIVRKYLFLPGNVESDFATWLRTIAVSTTVTDADFPPEFLNQFKTVLHIDIADTDYTYTVNPGKPADVETDLPAWTFVETRSFTVNTLNKNVRLTNLKTGTASTTNVTSASCTSALQNNIIPSGLARLWDIDPFEWFVTITANSRTEYTLVMERNIIFLNPYGNSIDPYSYSKSAVEVQIKARPKRGQLFSISPASTTVSQTGLNDRISSNLKDSDRRVFKRTRAWFSAVQTIRDVEAVSKLNTTTYPNIQVDMLAAVKQTVIATGFWDVWYTAFNQYISFLSVIKEPLLNILYNTSNFPGTRQ